MLRTSRKNSKLKSSRAKRFGTTASSNNSTTRRSWFNILVILLAILALLNILEDANFTMTPTASENSSSSSASSPTGKPTVLPSAKPKVSPDTSGKKADSPKYTIEAVSKMTDDQVSLALKQELHQEPIPMPPDVSETEDELGQTNAWKTELFRRLNRVRLLCGDLCTLNSREKIQQHSIPNPVVPELPTVVVPKLSEYCDNLLGMQEIDAGDLTFPQQIPQELRTYYTLDDALHSWGNNIRREAYLGGKSETKLWDTGDVWEETAIRQGIQDVGKGTFKGSYGVDETNKLRDVLSKVAIKDKHVLVIGSSHPWVEVVCLYHGAKHVTTLEYGTIDSRHPQISTETPETFRKKYQDGTLPLFDGIVTHSSLEHSGLGRYGDALNPWGDLLALARAWCVTRPGGFLWLGVPTGRDMIYYNWHRIYGKVRWPLMTANWKMTNSVGMDPNVTVMEKLGRGPWKGMANEGFLFEKLDKF